MLHKKKNRWANNRPIFSEETIKIWKSLDVPGQKAPTRCFFRHLKHHFFLFALTRWICKWFCKIAQKQIFYSMCSRWGALNVSYLKLDGYCDWSTTLKLQEEGTRVFFLQNLTTKMDKIKKSECKLLSWHMGWHPSCYTDRFEKRCNLTMQNYFYCRGWHCKVQ